MKLTNRIVEIRSDLEAAAKAHGIALEEFTKDVSLVFITEDDGDPAVLVRLRDEIAQHTADTSGFQFNLRVTVEVPDRAQYADDYEALAIGLGYDVDRDVDIGFATFYGGRRRGRALWSRSDQAVA